MTYRERLERKLELRQEWAERWRFEANTTFERNEQFTSDYAFNTQPGHVPIRARIIRQEEKAFERLKVAEHHEQCAASIERTLDNSIFSDDPDAIEALEVKIKANEEKRERMKLVNKLFRREDRQGLAALSLDYDALKARVSQAYAWEKAPYPAWQISNLGGLISKDKKRLEYLRQRKEREAKAASSINGILIEQCQAGYVRVTFAQKPDREILDALKAAGFFWNSGCWAGKAESLPPRISELASR